MFGKKYYFIILKLNTHSFKTFTARLIKVFNLITVNSDNHLGIDKVINNTRTDLLDRNKILL